MQKDNKKYYKYLQSQEWKDKRQYVFDNRGYKCERCGKTKDLHIHHKTYKNVFKEKLADLMVLCSVCHRSEHEAIKIKTIDKKKKRDKFKSEKNKKKNKEYIKRHTKPKSRFKTKTTSLKVVELLDGTKIKPVRSSKG